MTRLDTRYDEFVARSPQGTIFATSWWLDSVAPGRGDAVLVEKDGRISAAWPFVRRGASWPVRLDMPPLTPWLGIMFDPDASGKIGNRLGRQKDQIESLVAQLPRHDVVRARCHRDFGYWTPLSWCGFTQTTRYTFTLDDIRDTTAVWAGCRDNVRTDVRKAQRSGVRVEETDDVDDFWRIHVRTFERQGIQPPYGLDLVRRIDTACRSRGVRRIFLARGVDGCVHAGAYIVWDNRSAYYLLGGSDPERRNSGATALTLWHAIQFAADLVPVFDFEGSMLEPVERFVRSFGAEPKPYSVIERVDSRSLAMALTCRRLLHTLRYGT